MRKYNDTYPSGLNRYRRFALLLAVLVGAVPFHASAAPVPSGPINHHLAFEDMKFLDGDFVAKSGYKTAADRGLVLVEGRFGKGVTTTIAPSQNDIDNMSGIDLDLITATIFNTRWMQGSMVGYNEPILWGSGKVNPSAGSLAFWVKGPFREGVLFEQTACAWGRKERGLIGVTVDGDGRIGAYLDDSRYVRHTIVTAAPVPAEGWRHIVLNWDRAEGLELFIDGASAASSWGKDSWWETALPGLLRFPMPRAVYDEVYFFARPLAAKEIDALFKTNTPPQAPNPAADRTPAARDRLARALGISTRSIIPVLTPMTGNTALAFRQIEPDYMGDGHIPAHFCHDGRYELAWPHPISVFTIIPGDVDFTAEKLDIDPPTGVPFNYITVEGNLSGLSMLTGCTKSGDAYSGKILADPNDSTAFFHGEMLDRAARGRITVPFLKGYGAPEGFSGTVRLPLTGAARVHEVDMFDVGQADIAPLPGETVWNLYPEGDLDERTASAVAALFPSADRTVFHARRTPDGRPPATADIALLKRVHVITAPLTGDRTIGGIMLDFPAKTSGEDVLLVKIRDHAAPSRIWMHAEVKLKGFETAEGRLRLRLDCTPFMLAAGDRVWVEIAVLNGLRTRFGGPDGARIVLRPAPVAESAPLYEKKALVPALAEYSKMFGYVPWKFDRTTPDFRAPTAFGGPFDILYDAQAVRRVLPRSFLAEFYTEFSKPKYDWGNPADPEKDVEVRKFDIPAGVPRWAWLQRKIQNFRYRVVEWAAMNQNPDGQFGGGWNDDNDMLASKLDLFLDGSRIAHEMRNRLYEGFDATGYIEDGYCRLTPMDRLHVDDLLHDRFRDLLYSPGDPAKFRRALRTAWRWDKPQETPLNWGTGKSFLYDKGILEWYWGKSAPDSAFSLADTTRVTDRLLRLASFTNDLAFHQFTEARVYTDCQGIYDEGLITAMLVGGSADSTVSAEWTEGGGEDLARWVTRADSTSFQCRIHSFDTVQRKATVRLFRIVPGTYEVKLSEDIGGYPGRVLFTGDSALRRFDTVSVLVPPGKPVLLSVRLVKPEPQKGPLPDLAIAGYDCIRGKASLWVRVSNLGGAQSGLSSIRLYDAAGRELAEQKLPEIPAPLDFVEKSVWITFEKTPETGSLRIVADPRGKVVEIFKGNNEVTIE